MFMLDGEIGNYVICRNRKYSYFAGNNYLGLAAHPKVKEAAIRSVEKYGACFSASRQTTGTSLLHLELEKELSLFKQKNDSVIFASGFLGNRILVDVLKERFTSAFIDSDAHPSILYGIPGEIHDVYRYDHCNPADLEAKLKEYNKGKSLIITDGVFALTGEIAPLDKIYEIALKFDALIIVDDAHSTGILGDHGRGTPEYFGIYGANGIYQSETMSKAIGSYGGFISSDKEMINRIRKNSVIYQASTSLPPPIVASAIASLRTIMENPGLKEELAEKARILRNGIESLGFITFKGITPIIPIIEDSCESARNLSAFLERNGIIVPVVNYPGVKSNSLLRVTVSTLHEYQQIEILLDNLQKWKNKFRKTLR